MKERSSVCCPYCGAIGPIASATCHRCGKPTKKVVDSEASSAFLRRDDAIVRILQVIYTVVFLVILALTIRDGGTPLEAVSPGPIFRRKMIEFGSLHGFSVIYKHEWHRLLTATFMHSGLVHLIFNATSLLAIGPITEKYMGRSRFIATFLLSGVLSNVVSLLWNGVSLNQVGASGAICGAMGALYAVAATRVGAQGEAVKRQVLSWFTANLIFGLLIPFFDNAAHIGGAIAGFVLAKLLMLNQKKVSA